MKSRRRYNTNKSTLKCMPEPIDSDTWKSQPSEFVKKKSICVLHSHIYKNKYHEKIYVIPKLDNTELYLLKGKKFVHIEKNVYIDNEFNRIIGFLTASYKCIDNVATIRPYGHCDVQYSKLESLDSVTVDCSRNVCITHISTLGAPRIIKHWNNKQYTVCKNRNDEEEIINCGKRYVVENDKAWVKSFRVFIRLSGKPIWRDLGIFKGNVDRHTEVLHKLPSNTFARYIRIVPLEYIGTKALQIGVFGDGVPNKVVNARGNKYIDWMPYHMIDNLNWMPYLMINNRVWHCDFQKFEQEIPLPFLLKSSNVSSYTLSYTQKVRRKKEKMKQSHVISHRKIKTKLNKYVKSLSIK